MIQCICFGIGVAEAVAELRGSQQQAAPALRAAQHLHVAIRSALSTRPSGRPAMVTTAPASKPARPRPATTIGLAQLSFPTPPHPSCPVQGKHGPGPSDAP